jgi:hypothetical protein
MYKVLQLIPPGVTPLSVIESWYYNDDLFGACTSFEHVYCVNVKTEKIPRQSDLDPYQHFLVLFYEVKPMFKEVHILGTRTWPDLDKMDLFEHSKSFLMPYEVDENEDQMKESDDEDFYHDGSLPIVMPIDCNEVKETDLEKCANQAYSYVVGQSVKKSWSKLTTSSVSLFTR